LPGPGPKRSNQSTPNSTISAGRRFAIRRNGIPATARPPTTARPTTSLACSWMGTFTSIPSQGRSIWTRR
jgi:hypothetical protein